MCVLCPFLSLSIIREINPCVVVAPSFSSWCICSCMTTPPFVIHSALGGQWIISTFWPLRMCCYDYCGFTSHGAHTYTHCCVWTTRIVRAGLREARSQHLQILFPRQWVCFPRRGPEPITHSAHSWRCLSVCFSSSGECVDCVMLWYGQRWPSFHVFIDNVANLFCEVPVPLPNYLSFIV